MCKVISRLLGLAFFDLLHLQAVIAYELAVWMMLPVTEVGALAPLPVIPLTKMDRQSPAGVR